MDTQGGWREQETVTFRIEAEKSSRRNGTDGSRSQL